MLANSDKDILLILYDLRGWQFIIVAEGYIQNSSISNKIKGVSDSDSKFSSSFDKMWQNRLAKAGDIFCIRISG